MRFGRGIRRGTSAFYAGAVTLAMGGGMWLMPPTTASVAAPAQDCGGNGPLAVVTQGLCRVVGGLLDTVGNVGAALTGRELPDVEEKTTYQDFSGTGDGEAGEEATGREARDPRDTGAVPSPEATPRGRPDRRTGTGEEIAATATRANRCSGTAEPLLVCRAGGNGTGDGSAFPVVVEVGGDRASIRLLPGIPAPERLSGLERWLFAPDPDPLEREAAADRSGEAPYLMHDAYGRPLRDGLPGRAVAADDEHVVLLDGGPGEPARITVHRRG